MRTALDVHRLRAHSEPLLDFVPDVADAGYDGLHVAGGLGHAGGDEVAEAMARHGLDTAGATVDLDAIVDDITSVVHEYGTHLGCDTLAVTRPASSFAGADAVEDAAPTLDAAASRLAERDLALHYRVQGHEFATLDGQRAFDRFLAASDVDVYLDVGAARAAGADPVDLLYELDDRASLVRLTDVASESGLHRPLGEGDVDLRGCVGAAREVGADWLVYGHEYPDDPVASLSDGARYVAELVSER